jgi:nucleoside-specific outer membrane channel protein Tsx
LSLKRILLLAVCCLTLDVHALTSVSAIYGNGYRVVDHQQWRLRFEHVSKYRYGDNFFFFAVQNPTAAGTNIYSEFAPRLSFSKISNKRVGLGFIKDTLLAGQLNYNGIGTRVYLYGIGFDLSIPYFKFFQLNFYRRKNPTFSDGTFQITPVWLLPIKLGRFNLTYNGFLDYTGSENHLKTHLLSRSQLLADLGELTGKAKNTLYLGPRFSYWRHKRGISGENDRVLEFMLQWRLE